uniref:BTB domain-containing protein n=1 Tax=Heterostelium pallidum (strain ATCC 26659 / Pp 5 / PN500) TaxID=670386 RepID=D3BP49_HETP5|nr:hypothetical protein PPL_09812 [Heterostelium album PN500]EFA77059.1 hypothetical protein PPL_09812 [Heterostelium album PN500]|eukprot:XP_020429188.1 hypothetical protein PPL_09812 [Heterostelium album PN500]
MHFDTLNEDTEWLLSFFFVDCEEGLHYVSYTVMHYQSWVEYLHKLFFPMMIKRNFYQYSSIMISTSPGNQSSFLIPNNSNSSGNNATLNSGSFINGANVRSGSVIGISNSNISNNNNSNTFKGHSRTNHSNGGNNTIGNYFEAPLFQEGFGSFLKSGEFSDLTIHSEGKQYHLHRVILAHSSKYFSDYFDLDNNNSNNNNNNSNNKMTTIKEITTTNYNNNSNSNNNDIPVTTYFTKIDNNNYELKGPFIEHFDMVVNYMYEGRVNLTPKNALPLLSLSNCFQIKGLKKYATFYLTNSITKENAFFMLNKAIHINSDDLTTKCITVICKHFNQMIQPHFSHIFTQPQPFIMQPNYFTNNNNNNNNNNNTSTANYSDELDSIATVDQFTSNLESSLNNNTTSEPTSTNSDSDDSDLDSFSSSTTATTTTTITNNNNTHSNSSHHHQSSIHIPQTSNPIGISSKYGSPSPSNSILSSSMANDKSLNISTIHTIPELLSLPISIMIRLMRQNNLSVSNEAVVYKTIVKYIQANKSSLSEQDIESLFECVRFPLFNYQQLEEVQDNTLIPKSLITEALMLRLRLHEGPKDVNSASNLSLSPSNNLLQSNSKSPTSSSINVQYSGGNNINSNTTSTSTTATSSSIQITPSVIVTSSSLPSSSLLTSTLTSALSSTLNINNINNSNSSNNNTGSILTSLSNNSSNSSIGDSLVASTESANDSSALIRRTPRAPFAISLEYNNEMKGVFYYIGTNGLKDEWSNPANRGRVRVTFSSIEKGNVTDVVGRQPTECWTMDVPASWIAINLGSSRTLVPTFYTLRHGGNSKADCLRNWTLQGSMDSKNWTILSRHSNDSSLNGNYSTWTCPIENCTQAYRHFRILQTGRNSTNHNFLSLSGIEFYGDLYETRKDD